MTWGEHFAGFIAGLFWMLSWLLSWPGRGLGNLSMWCENTGSYRTGEVLLWLSLVVSIPALLCLFLANLIDKNHEWI